MRDNEKEKKSYLIILALTALFLFLVISSSAQSAFFGEQYIYVANEADNTVSIIDTANNTVTATVIGLNGPSGVAVNPAGTRIYVTNWNDNTVSVIGTTTNTVITNVSVGQHPEGVVVTPDKVYAAKLWR